MTVHRLDSHDLLGQLGLVSQRLRFGYCVEMDFQEEVGTVLRPPAG